MSQIKALVRVNPDLEKHQYGDLKKSRYWLYFLIRSAFECFQMQKPGLNIFLVQNGCLSGGTMQRMKAWREMGKAERKSFGRLGKPKVKLLVDDSTYKAFMEKIILAETQAKEKELGIWSATKE